MSVHFPPGTRWIAWRCPNCRHAGPENIDSPYLTVVPLCGYCNAEVQWPEMIEPLECDEYGLPAVS